MRIEFDPEVDGLPGPSPCACREYQSLMKALLAEKVAELRRRKAS